MHTTMVVEGESGTQQVSFDNCIIAVGATTRLLAGTTLSERVVTYEEQILDRELPASGDHRRRRRDRNRVRLCDA